MEWGGSYTLGMWQDQNHRRWTTSKAANTSRLRAGHDVVIVCTYICCMYVCTPLRLLETQAPCRFGFPPPCLLPYSCATRKAIAVWQIYRRSAAHCFFVFSLTCTARDLGRQVKLGSSSVATVFVEKLQRQLIRLVRSQRVVGTTHPVERIAIVSSKSFPR